MPIYATICRTCGQPGTVYRKVAERNDHLPQCCGATVERAISAPAVFGDIQPYESPATGQWIMSKSARREDLKRSGCIEWDAGARKAVERNKQAAWDKDMEFVDKVVDDVVRDFAVSGKLDV